MFTRSRHGTPGFRSPGGRGRLPLRSMINDDVTGNKMEDSRGVGGEIDLLDSFNHSRLVLERSNLNFV